MDPMIAKFGDSELLQVIQVIIAVVTLVPLSLKIFRAATKEPKKAAMVVVLTSYPGFLLGYGISNNDWIIGAIAAAFLTWTGLYFAFE